jgi:hypothetical protein
MIPNGILMLQEQFTSVGEAYRALCVVILDKAVRAFLQENDPNCLRQAENAASSLEAAFPDLEKPEGRKFKAPDFTYRDEGSLMLLAPDSEFAKGWVEEHIPDDAQWFGNYLAIERRFFQNILDGIDADGLTFAPEGSIEAQAKDRIHRAQPKRRIVGMCPACFKAVFDDEDAVWTCAHNLNANNPLFKPSEFECDFNHDCGAELPLHSNCYDHGSW